MTKEQLLESILQKEWNMFQKVNNAGGRASCQDDMASFVIMRTAQLLVWGDSVLSSYHQDLEQARMDGRNLMTEKYARMMEFTHPEEYRKIRASLPELDEFVKDLARVIVDVYTNWEAEVKRLYPNVRSRGRREASQAQGYISAAGYLYCELLTYSERTLTYMICYMGEKQGQNLYIKELENIAKAYGYQSLDDAEKAFNY